jgi:hypothetical protein
MNENRWCSDREWNLRAESAATLERTADVIVRVLLPLASLALACAAAGACGGDDDDDGAPLSSYLTQLSAVVSLGNVQTQGLAERYPTAFEDVQATKDYYTRYVDGYARFLDATKQLNAPDELSAEHNEYVAASEAVLAIDRARLAELESATTADELNTIFVEDPEYAAAVQRQDDACPALKMIAEQNEISAPGLADCSGLN